MNSCKVDGSCVSILVIYFHDMFLHYGIAATFFGTLCIMPGGYVESGKKLQSLYSYM